MKNATLSLKVLLIDKDKETVYKAVDDVINIIKDSNLPNIVGPSETTVDGNIDDLLNLLKTIFDFLKPFEQSIFVSSQFMYKKTGITPMNEKINGKN